MRATLNAILAFIGAESLTDEEYESIGDIDMTSSNVVFNALAVVLQTREYVTDMVRRLKYYYLAKGITVTLTGEAEGVETGVTKSNIIVGGSLE